MSAAGIAVVNTVGATDTDLVAAVRDGDDVAFEELYRRYYPRIATFVRGYLRDGGRAEDVTQEAFMSALRRLRQTDAAITFKPWIFEIARNAAIDQYRRNVRTDEVSIDIEGGFAPSEVARVVRPRGPDSSVLDKERLEHLKGALDELSDTHHRIIVMRELEGLSYREIGEKLELTQAAVESTLFRARRKLEHEYSQLDTGRRCQLIGAVIARLAEGMDSRRDRRRLDRHARRCSTCRRRARELGVEPILPRATIAARAAALLPLPAFARRRFGGDAAGGAAQNAAAPIGAVGAPTLEVGAAVAGKAVAVVAAVALVGGGGATLKGLGPLDLGGNGRTALEKQQDKPAAPKSASPTLGRDAFRDSKRDGAAPPAKPVEGKSGADGGAFSTKKQNASPKPKQEPQPGIPGLGPGLLPVPRSDERPEGDSPGFEEPSPEQQRPEIPSLAPGASAPPAPTGPDEILSALGEHK